VFLAEDDHELRRLLDDVLRRAGFAVRAVADGAELLELIAASDAPTPDAFVMDVRMPRRSGVDVLRALRARAHRQPVILMSGFAEPELKEEAARRGAAIVLDKPFEPDDLVALVDVLLRLAHAEVMKPANDDEEEDDATAPGVEVRDNPIRVLAEVR